MVVQPRIMHVLLALADARGAVVTRDALADRCWAGRFVAEDSLNGAIAELRKALRTVSAHDVSVETVPKTGYRLATPEFVELSSGNSIVASGVSGEDSKITRRVVLAAGAAAVVGTGLAGWMAANRGVEETALLIERGSQALRQGLPDANAQGVQFLSKAVEMDPGNAKGWGMMALAWRASADYGGPDNAAKALSSAEFAAKRALALDPRQSDALTALATLRPSFGQWVEADRRIRGVLAIDPDNSFAVTALGTLLMSTGQVQASLDRSDWLVERDPLSPNLQFRRVYMLWSVGRLGEMDRTADRALQSWPRHPAVWFSRFWTLAFTGRATQAQAMLDDAPARPPMPQPAVRGLDLSLRAIVGNRPPDVRAAVAANVAAASLGPSQATAAIMVLSHLGASAAAYDVASGFLLRQGPVAVRMRHTIAQPSITDQHHRLTMMLWVPATEALRFHPEYRSMCEGMGLIDFWKATRTRPDFSKGSLALI